MKEIEKDAMEAKALGLSYGQYKAKIYDHTIKQKENSREKISKKRYEDKTVFDLWRAGYTDAEIASEIGVSRTIIQRWRDIMELPSTRRNKVDTSLYRMEQLSDGTIVCIMTE